MSDKKCKDCMAFIMVTLNVMRTRLFLELINNLQKTVVSMY